MLNMIAFQNTETRTKRNFRQKLQSPEILVKDREKGSRLSESIMFGSLLLLIEIQKVFFHRDSQNLSAGFTWFDVKVIFIPEA